MSLFYTLEERHLLPFEALVVKGRVSNAGMKKPSRVCSTPGRCQDCGLPSTVMESVLRRA